MIGVFVFIFGAIIGSFLTVCAYRIPLSRADIREEIKEMEEEKENFRKVPKLPDNFSQDLSISSPARSFCPKCGATLSFWQNIPIISWFLLRGRCHYCKEKIPFRYPLTEILTAFFALGSYYYFGFSLAFFIAFFILCILWVITLIDYDYYIIPNTLTYPSIAAGLICSWANGRWHFLPVPFCQNITESLIGLVVGAGFLLLISEAFRLIRGKIGLGMGDIKLLAVTGVFFGYQGSFVTIFIGSVLGTLIGVALVLFKIQKAGHYLPFGPFLAAANAFYIFYGAHPLVISF
ncbi:MAG: prepilin peptidase [Candidatus Dadabacteria bacterium]|nr:MAG: prepilin peptidase [Candidatus Dadabacteria bacterium]